MDTLMQERWTEVRFYCICSDVLTINNNIIDVMDFIDNMAQFGQYPAEPIKALAHEILSSIRHRPTREEFCILCHTNKVPVSKIKARMKTHNNTLYKIIEENKKEPRLFYPRSRPEQISLMAQFVQAFDKIKDFGV